MRERERLAVVKEDCSTWEGINWIYCVLLSSPFSIDWMTSIFFPRFPLCWTYLSIPFPTDRPYVRTLCFQAFESRTNERKINGKAPLSSWVSHVLMYSFIHFLRVYWKQPTNRTPLEDLSDLTKIFSPKTLLAEFLLRQAELQQSSSFQTEI